MPKKKTCSTVTLFVVIINVLFFGTLLALYRYNTQLSHIQHKFKTMNIPMLLSRNFTGKTLSNKSKRVFNDYLTYPGNFPLVINCKSCSYVTGSGHLIDSNKGREIDSRDCVIRSNNAPTIGYEKDVGKKTTFRTVDRNSFSRITRHVKSKFKFDPEIYSSTRIMLYGYDRERILREKLVNESSKSMPWIPVYLVTNERFQRMLDIYDKRIEKNNYKIWFTNGFITIMFLHDICDVTHVYGVADDKHCDLVEKKLRNDTLYHYYPKTQNTMSECKYMRLFDKQRANTHRYTREKTLFRQLAKEWGNLYFHSPEWR